MKIQILNFALAGVIAFGSISCKDNNSSKSETNDVEEVAEATDTAITYNVDTDKSVIHWTGSKPAGKHTGTLHLSKGNFGVQDGSVESGEFTIDMNTLKNTDMDGEGATSLETHLKGLDDESKKDFFNVTEFPTAWFEITSIEGEGANATVSGNLTIKDITQNISFPANVSFPDETLVLKSEVFKIDRTKWNINFMSKSVFTDLKDKFIDDEIELQIEVHGAKA